jgi:hypothetical protein
MMKAAREVVAHRMTPKTAAPTPTITAVLDAFIMLSSSLARGRPPAEVLKN